MTVKEEKHAMRRRIRLLAGSLPPEYFSAAGRAICRRILQTEAYKKAGTVFCFVSYGKEPDTYPLIRQVLQDGKTLCVPLCREDGRMEAKRISSLSQLTPGAYNIPEPPQDAPSLSPEQIHLALIPCLAATKDGKRLGKGGGYYDRFLAGYAGDAFLLCPAELLQTDIPTELHDVRIPHVVTE